MAVLKMQRICICALKKDRKHILELLQRCGVIELNDVLQEDGVFRKTDVFAAVNGFEKNIALGKSALEILEVYSKEEKSKLSVLNGREEVPAQEYDEFQIRHDEMVHASKHVYDLEKKIAEGKAEILKQKTQIEVLSPWVTLDIPLLFKGTKETAAFIGVLPGEWTLERIYGQLADLDPVNVDIISTSVEQTCIFVLCTKEKESSVSDELRAAGFSYPSIAGSKSPAEMIRDLENHMAATEKSIQEAMDEIRKYAARREEFKFFTDYETMRLEKYGVLSGLLQSKSVFVLTGYIPQEEAEGLTEKLNERFTLHIEFQDTDEEEDVPVKLKNNGFSAPLIGTVESFSLPGKNELDPTMVMSLFYYALFGLMLSDAGYGLIMTAACGWALIRFKDRLEDSMRNALKMFLFCGIATVFWGVMFGSYFGDLVDIVSETFFGQKVTIPPLWFLPINEPMRMLVFSMALGCIHLLTGLGMKLYQCYKQKDFKGMLYDVIFWDLLLISCILILLSMEIFVNTVNLSFILPSSVSRVAGVVALISAAGIIATNGRESKNPFKRFLKGLYALYGITGYLSDVISYSRLLALGLATGVICSVINKMAAMTAGIPLGAVIFTVIVVAGHALNIAINALGAYVHATRLQYVEFFGKFYEGGGRKFNPFGVHTKYYKFKETMKNG